MNVILILIFSITASASPFCRYTYTIWNNQRKISEGPFTVTKSYKELSAFERSSEGCTICEEDQREVRLRNGVIFKVCKTVAGRIQDALNKSIAEGYVITQVTGYRPSMSKGALNSRGQRTEFSRHAFGLGIDINEQHNGLYDQCINWGPSCRLIKGGAYSKTHPLSITPDSPVTRHLKGIGFKWGGEIQGFQKDFMHFSPDGL